MGCNSSSNDDVNKESTRSGWCLPVIIYNNHYCHIVPFQNSINRRSYIKYRVLWDCHLCVMVVM